MTSVCLCTPDIVGPVRNGGIGTAFYNLAILLANNGYKVTIAYTLGHHFESHDLTHWQQFYREKGIDFVALYPLSLMEQGLQENEAISKIAADYLKTQNFNIIHFPEWRGSAYYTLKLKDEGIVRAKIIVQVHSPSLWHAVNNGDPLDNPAFLKTCDMEKFTLEQADFLTAPSEYMFDWLDENDFVTTASHQVIPNLFTPQTQAEQSFLSKLTNALRPNHLNELVFFGRLEYRKGLFLFIDALKILKPELTNIKITFLGKDSLINGRPSTQVLHQTMQHEGLDYQVISNFNSFEASTYLQAPGRLAVIASLSENSPYVVIECLNMNIPFIAANTGGIIELIAEKDHSAALFQPTPESLAAKIQQALRSKLKTHTPKVKQPKAAKTWLQLHQNIDVVTD